MMRIYFGGILISIGILRILDVLWSVQLLPWPFYAIEALVGVYLVISGTLKAAR